MTYQEPERFAVPVEGGSLTVGRWGEGTTVVLCSHGITANHVSFGELAWALREADVSVYALDHRGRGGSARHPGPFGLRTHAQDLVAVADHIGADRAVLVGHSMGAYIAAAAGDLMPERFPALVLIDGALPIPLDLPPGVEIEDAVRAVIGPALDRLDMTFASPEVYLDRWREHPSFQGEHFNDLAEAHFRYDLVRDGATWRSGVSKAATLADGAGPLEDEHVRTAIARLQQPTTLLLAGLGMLGTAPPLFPDEVVAAAVDGLDHVEVTRLPDVNHYTILLHERGARRVADAVLDAISHLT
jgi:lipase